MMESLIYALNNRFQIESFSTLLKFSVLPIAKVLIMCGLGFLMATSYINILPAKGLKLLSKLIFTLFLPCLIFTQLGKAVTLQKMLQWWFIPVNVLMGYTIGCFIGLLVALIVRPPKGFFKFTIVMIGVGNIGNIPLVLVGAVCRDKNNPFAESGTCNEQGVAYISFGQWVGAVIVYTFVFHMLSPSNKLDEPEKPEFDVETDPASTIPLLVDHQESGDTNTCEKHTVLEWINKTVDHLKLKQILQPPVTASILALVVGAAPILKNFILTDGAPLFFFSDSLNILGGAMVPCIMLVLGGNLAGGPGSSQLGVRTTIAITFTRLFVIPPFGLGIVSVADRFGFLPAGDKMFRFVLLLQHSMPSSILAGAVASLRGVAEKEASAILFWEHILALISLTLWLGLYLNVLF